MSYDIKAIDAVVNICTDEAMAHRPKTSQDFFVGKIGVEQGTYNGISHEEMLRRMDAAGIEMSFLIANKSGQMVLPSSSFIPYEVVADAVKAHPDRFKGLAGIDPTQGMKGVKELERAVNDLGFIGAHWYPHWFDMPPNHARVYPSMPSASNSTFRSRCRSVSPWSIRRTGACAALAARSRSTMSPAISPSSFLSAFTSVSPVLAK